ncbi:adenosine receptor A2a-like [Acanthaster planci]|uniref:Adenosine receptor A2a-like n=1 Tax=Acanthaster planci TaxID=133434 RepID=A0A8B7XJ60_ACAPL|nr:adenosine receptor A2a-like [Acanthaster planci]
MVAAGELVLVVFLIILLTGTVVVTNGCMFAAFFRNRQLRTVNNYMFMTLSFANVMVGLSYPLQSLVNVKILNYGAVCLPIACVLLVFGIVIAWTVVALTVERYLTILHPFAVQRILTGSRVLGILASIVFYAVVVGAVVPGALSTTAVSPEATANGANSNGTSVCRLYNLVPSRAYRFFYLANRLVSIPFFLGIYLRIFIVARRHLQAIAVQVVPAGQEGPFNDSTGSTDSVNDNARRVGKLSKARWRREIKLTLLVFAIALFQSICWIPHTILLMQNRAPPSIYYTLTHFFTYSNTAIYPLIYGLGNRDFRQTMTSMFGCHAASG